ncbi:alpha/beta fold hydrolase [Xylophilus sp. ASV27]|uniref:alpha/beta fold hydrolase n=1 Tax=Xylophilus sp. ASV27 TaxID=2795129 RepID=UPI001E57001D|nr:alpha/beta fold hydrolase [Xylophilus sp. ASV27]
MKSILPLGALVLAVLLLAALFWLWTPDKDRAWLERRYLASPADMLEVSGAMLHVRDSGPRDAPAVLMIHGFASSLDTWDALARALEATHRVIRFDLPGNGLSPPDPSRNYTDARSIELVLALQDRLGLRASSVVGHSIGGRIAWTLAALHPERVTRLVLIAPDGFASPGFRYGEAPKVPSMFTLMRYALPKALLRSSLEPAYADPAMVTQDLLDRYHDYLLAPGARQALLDRMEQTVLVDPVPLLRRVRAPTLLLWGEQDAMIPIANAQDYLAALADARLVSIAGTGHLPQEEAAARSAKVVQEFLDAGEVGRR